MANQECFVHRVQEIPMVSATVTQALNAYEKTKNYNRLMSATLALAENSVKYALEKAQPVRKILDGPIVATNKLACQQLEKFEERYPVILTTPEEILKNGKDYYDGSYVKTGVDTVYSIKDYGVEKVSNSKKMATNLVHGVVYGGPAKFVDVFRYGMFAVDNALTYSDSLIDTYLTPPGHEMNGKKTYDDDSFAIARIRRMSSKVYSGLKYKAANGYVVSKDYAFQIVGQLQSALVLLEYAKNTPGWASEETMGKLLAGQEHLATLWHTIQKRISQYGSAELALLYTIQRISSVFTSLSDQILKYSTPYLPEGMEKNVAYAVQYAHDLDEAVSQAKTLSELKDEAVNEFKERLTYIHSIYVDVLDRVSVYPPISWMSLEFDGGMNLFDDDEEDLFDMDRENRRPLSLNRFLHIGLPILEPRNIARIHFG